MKTPAQYSLMTILIVGAAVSANPISHPGRAGAARLLGSSAWYPDSDGSDGDASRGRRDSTMDPGTTYVHQQLAGLGKPPLVGLPPGHPTVFTPFVSVGVFTDLEDFFQLLRNNLVALREEEDIQRHEAVETSPSRLTAPAALVEERGPQSRPSSPPAMMRSVWSQHRPSEKTRSFVANSEPAALRRSNHHDPQLLWAGLGRRRR